MVDTAHNEGSVYPTWFEYVWRYLAKCDPTSDEELVAWMCKYRIPADIAEKLGIEPKEG